MNITEVAVAVFIKPDGTFLLSSRPEGKPYAGFWEFPGGKIEAGETVLEALVRELSEELAVAITEASPWFTFTMRYTHAHVRLHCWRVQAWRGEMRGLEGQLFEWQSLRALTVAPTLPGCVPIFKALALPLIYIELEVNIDQVLLTSTELAAMTARPPHKLIGALVSTRNELEDAAKLMCDFAVVNMVERSPQGWQLFSTLATATPLPCYVAGAVTEQDLAMAISHGAQGIARLLVAKP